MSTEVRVPTLGESVTEATVATWFKKPGDSVAIDEMLCELETDKVTVEVPSPAAGTLSEIVAEEGATVGVDALLANIAEGAGAAAAPADPTAEHHEEQKPAAAAAPEAGGGAALDVMVPTLGESVTEATVATWFKAEGDTVAADEMLCELETDKVSVEVPAPAAGTLTKILKGEGETVEAGGVLAQMASGAGAAAPAPAASDGPVEHHEAQASGKDVEDAPSAKKMMAEKGLSSDQVQGTGKDGRVMKEDVQKAIAAGVPGEQVDGCDVIAVRAAVGDALYRARAGEGGSLIECVTYRLGDHTTADNASRYREDAEVSEAWRREPIRRLRDHLSATHGWTKEDEEALRAAAHAKVEAAAEVYLATPAMPATAMFEHLHAAPTHALLQQRADFEVG